MFSIIVATVMAAVVGICLGLAITWGVCNRDPNWKTPTCWLAGLGAILLLECCILPERPYSRGERYGTVIKFSERGVFVKTWEGELLMGQTRDTTFDFTVRDPALVPKLQQALQDGRKVLLGYQEVLARWPWNGETDYGIMTITEK